MSRRFAAMPQSDAPLLSDQSLRGQRCERHRDFPRDHPLPLAAVGDPEGSRGAVRTVDPVTTDPKGEVRRSAASPQIYATYNTPALTDTRDAYGGAALDPWYVTGLTEGEGCFCVSFAIRPKLRVGLEARPSFSLSLNERDRALLEDLRAFFR